MLEIGPGAHQVAVELGRAGGVGDRHSQTGAQQQEHRAGAGEQTEDEKQGIHGGQSALRGQRTEAGGDN